MIKARLKIPIVLVLALFDLHLAHAESGVSNSADLAREQNNIWFLGSEPVYYCIKRAPDYPADQDLLSRLVGESLHDWQQLFRTYGFSSNAFGEGALAWLKFPDGLSRSLAQTFIEKPDCDSPNEQITFLFGVKPSDANAGTFTKQADADANSAVFEDPNELGAALRFAYNHQTYRTGGVVWIRDFTNERLKIKHVLLHELGHVFGVKHNAVFVMDEHMADWLVQGNDPAFGYIESPTWVYRVKENTELNFYYNKMSGRPSCQSNQQMPASLQALLGIRSYDEHRVKVTYLGSVSGTKGKFKLNLADCSQSYDPEFQGIFQLNQSVGGPGLYTAWNLGESGRQVRVRGLLDPAEFILPAYGYFVINGQNFPAVLEYHAGIKFKIFIPQESLWWSITDEERAPQ